MAKAKRMYGCTECGATFPKWAGQCSECGAWNTLTETMIESGGAAAHWPSRLDRAAGADQDLGRSQRRRDPAFLHGVR